MLLEVLPDEIRQHMVVAGNMNAANAIYRTLLAFQPGGLGERQRLLQGLTDAADKLRKWQRWSTRSQALVVATPDAALLLAGLDKLVASVLSVHAQVAFRCSIARTQNQLDFNPSVSAVTEYARLLQAEMDTLALFGVDVDMDANTGNKRASVAQLEAKGTPKGGAPKGQQDKGGKAQEGQRETRKPEKTGKGSPNDAEKGTDSKQPCKFFLTKNGCSMVSHVGRFMIMQKLWKSGGALFVGRRVIRLQPAIDHKALVAKDLARMLETRFSGRSQAQQHQQLPQPTRKANQQPHQQQKQVPKRTDKGRGLGHRGKKGMEMNQKGVENPTSR